jgi:hypothetical protein
LKIAILILCNFHLFFSSLWMDDFASNENKILFLLMCP